MIWNFKADNDKAIADYDEAIQLDPKFTWAYVNRGYAWTIKKEFDKAIADYTAAIRIDSPVCLGLHESCPRLE